MFQSLHLLGEGHLIPEGDVLVIDDDAARQAPHATNSPHKRLIERVPQAIPKGCPPTAAFPWDRMAQQFRSS
eukprot:1191618-Prorocentrum_minimum.AAC.3